MIELQLSHGRWNKLKSVLDFSESAIKNSCTRYSTLRLKSCINAVFNQVCRKEVSHLQKAGLKWSMYGRHLREVSLNGLPYWLNQILAFFESYSLALKEEKNQFNCRLRLWSQFIREFHFLLKTCLFNLIQQPYLGACWIEREDCI